MIPLMPQNSEEEAKLLLEAIKDVNEGYTIDGPKALQEICKEFGLKIEKTSCNRLVFLLYYSSRLVWAPQMAP